MKNEQIDIILKIFKLECYMDNNISEFSMKIGEKTLNDYYIILMAKVRNKEITFETIYHLY